ncbi:MAG: DNA starvation/stationary phase protection protein [Oscillatoriales cyanobacterium C42_A2020_001]|nr:DNA starvation/stationary phase protection protein [Leptolyngbyaceae cyanobacterium C42_A2020_001]
MRQINIGLTEEQRQGVVELLNQDLSNSYLLQLKTKKYHWDVIGPQFRTLHEIFEEQYTALAETIDSIAERIRQLGAYPAGTAKEFLEFASIQEAPGRVPSPTQMVANLLEDHELVIRSLRQHVDKSSEDFHDEGTADFLTGLMEQHEEMAWMLRSFIEGESLNPDGALPENQNRVAVGSGSR